MDAGSAYARVKTTVPLPDYFEAHGHCYKAFAGYERVTATRVDYRDSEDSMGGLRHHGWYVAVDIRGIGPAEVPAPDEEQATALAELIMANAVLARRHAQVTY